MMRRRALLQAMGACAASLASNGARAMGRTPLGGRVALHVPFSLASIDPHELRDVAAALFAPAICDPLFSLDASGAPYPTLAAAMPTREGDDVVVRMREGLVSAHGKSLDARDAVFSIERARARGAASILADVPKPRVKREDRTALLFATGDEPRLARALSSPLVALVPRGFDPKSPDGTGAFEALLDGGALALARNKNAARGASFLERVDVASASDLTTSLRDFEAERDDIGWLGMGLHEPRKTATRFDLGRVALVVLEIGGDAGAASAPGVAQALVDAFPPERLAHLALGSLPSATGDPAWIGPPCELLVDEGSAFLVEVAKSVAPILSRSGHEVTATSTSRAELAKRRASKKATLVVDAVRPVFSTQLGVAIALAAAEDAARATDIDRHPPKIGAQASARSMTSALRIGVVGEVRVAGGVASDLVLARASNGGWDIGASWRKAKR